MTQLSMFPAVVVFTGPAKLKSGTVIVREALKRATEAAGMRMGTAIKGDTAYLVASRTDTVKARNAEKSGLMVLTYDQFVKHLRDLGVNALDDKFAEGATFNKIVDTAPEAWSPVDQAGAIVL